MASVHEDSERKPAKSASAFRTISEVASELDVPAHVLRFWESKFSHVRPLKRCGGRRYYRPEDVDLLRGIRELLYTDGYTIKGVQKLLRESGGKALAQSFAESENGEPGTGVENGQSEIKASDARTGVPTSTPSGDELPGWARTELRELLQELESLKAAVSKLV